MNLVLLGYRGSGKSSIGKKLANELWKDFVDLDDQTRSRFNNQAIAEGAAGLNQLVDALVEASGQIQGKAGPSYDQEGRLQHNSVSAMLFDGRV